MKESESPVLPIFESSEIGQGIDSWHAYGKAAGGLILRGLAGAPTRQRALDVASKVGVPRRSVVGLDDPTIEVVYDITPRGEGVKDRRGVVIRSTTYQGIPLHTDGYNADPPPRIMVLQVAIPGRGGLTTAADVVDVVASLRPGTLETLQLPDYPVAAGTTSIIRKTESGWKVRFNSYEIQSFLAAQENVEAITPAHLEALSELVEVAEYLESQGRARTKLQEGDVVIVDNERLLHGRLALEPDDSERLLHRVWCD